MRATSRLFDKIINRLPYAVLASAALVVATTAAVTGNGSKVERDDAQPATVKLVVDDSPVSRDGKFGVSFAPVVKKVAPSVVKVTTSTKVKQASMQDFPGFDNPMLRRFFGEEFEQRAPRRQQNMPRQHGVGSGVIVTKDGYILTNNHVVDEADEVKVAMQDGREFTGKVIGKDPKTDIAVLKIDAKDLPFLQMADSDKIEVGDIVLAVGNPFGIGQTVTMGMVSATGRATLGLDYEDFIQTDAAINPGNSGGALVDAEGRLIGINTAILSRSGGNQGIGFAIPTGMIRPIMKSLVATGKVARGWLGVGIQDVDRDLAASLGLTAGDGVIVGQVEEGSPASSAGIQRGDLIRSIGGDKVHSSAELRNKIAALAPGSTARVEVVRDKETRTIDVKLGAHPEPKAGSRR